MRNIFLLIFLSVYIDVDYYQGDTADYSKHDLQLDVQGMRWKVC